MFCNPPNKMRKAKPVFIQIVEIETASKANFGSSSHSISDMPNMPMILFNIPIVGLYINIQITDEAATLIPIVEENSVLKMPIPLTFSFAINAKNSAKMIPAGTVKRTKSNVALILFLKLWDCNNYVNF